MSVQRVATLGTCTERFTGQRRNRRWQLVTHFGDVPAGYQRFSTLMPLKQRPNKRPDQY